MEEDRKKEFHQEVRGWKFVCKQQVDKVFQELYEVRMFKNHASNNLLCTSFTELIKRYFGLWTWTITQSQF